MFAIATRNFVEEVDSGGCLVPVCSLNDSVTVLTVVVKRRRFWFWQRPKYQPTDFTLNDLLTGDTPIKPVVAETDFIKYSGTFGDNVQGNVDASFINSSVKVEGKDSSKLQSLFGSLKKEEVDVQKLLRDCKDRVLDMSHCLILQAKEKHRRVFGVVKERIVTTQPCSVIEDVQQGGECGGSLAPCGPKYSKVLLKENGSLSKDSNVTMEIPTHTTIAYGLIELEVKQDGHFKLCLMSDTTGGFQTDGPVREVGAPEYSCDNSLIHKELELLSDHFLQLSSLPSSIRSSLLQQITELMQDGAAVGALQHVLNHMSEGYKPESAIDARQQNIRAVVELLEQTGQSGQSSSVLAAVQLMSSVLEEMKTACLADLRGCCDPKVLQTLELLVQCVCGSGQMPLSKVDLTKDMWEKTEHLFACSNVCLKKDRNVIMTEINPQPGHHPLLLCVAVKCLVSLAHGL
ncbi:gasdermin Eb [Gouania willdenowi]|uniref:Gasdermin pore forming domain-containing protein n=1 Tax=Gouania willdenowi TaxID=441366 RepID=A0A8C5GA35_GOUWI|nr:gasdermin-E [Gouania willdenowi]